jgi:capsular polysaccharide transport system permease protein
VVFQTDRSLNGARTAREHARIVWALLLRELATRYGRQNIGFLWAIAEPLLFCAGVIALWTTVRGPYEHGVRIVPFVVTGYMPIIQVRHMINQTLNCVRANAGLLYHRHITVLHLFLARLVLEFIGVSMAFAIVVLILWLIGVAPLPRNLLLLYGGWAMLGWLSASLAMVLGALAQIVEVVERFVALFTYVLVPLSGTFYMVDWVAPAYRKLLLYLPFIHPVEMIRGGFFGSEVRTYYDVGYVSLWAVGLMVTGLLLLRFVRERIEVE